MALTRLSISGGQRPGAVLGVLNSMTLDIAFCDEKKPDNIGNK